jgi:hypothetical protein
MKLPKMNEWIYTSTSPDAFTARKLVNHRPTLPSILKPWAEHGFPTITYPSRDNINTRCQHFVCCSYCPQPVTSHDVALRGHSTRVYLLGTAGDAPCGEIDFTRLNTEGQKEVPRYLKNGSTNNFFWPHLTGYGWREELY